MIENCLVMTCKPAKEVKKKKWMSKAYELRLQKKWMKKYGVVRTDSIIVDSAKKIMYLSPENFSKLKNQIK